MHKAAYWSLAENVNCLLELGASPNYRDPLGLTPLYYNMLHSNSKSSVAQMLLYNYSDIAVTDLDGNHEIHQVCTAILYFMIHDLNEIFKHDT